jgi:hypothetical protein
MGAAVDHASVLAALCYVSAILLCVVSPSTAPSHWAWASWAPAPSQSALAGTSAAAIRPFLRRAVSERSARRFTRGDNDNG